MEILWEHPFSKDVECAAVGNGYAVVASGNTLYWLSDSKTWKKKFRTTFYRDPYSDVKVTCVAADHRLVAAGTNFMDGKLYLIDSEGEILWEQQFATIASLGWRPEDVTALALGEESVVAGTEFTSEYIYAYTVGRKRLFEKRVSGTVKSIAINRNIAIGTDRFLYLLDKNGRLIFKKHVSTSNVDFAGNTLIFSADNELGFIYNEDMQTINFEDKIDNVFYSDGRIYVFTDRKLAILSENGETIDKIELDATPVAAGKGGILFHKNGTLYLSFLPK